MVTNVSAKDINISSGVILNIRPHVVEPDPGLNIKRPSWDEYFLKIALDVSRRSTCLRRSYGAVITKDNIIISTGYNGAPRGETHCTDSLICVREELNIPKGERYELCVAVHAECNAIINADPEKLHGSTIYIAGYEYGTTDLADGAPCKMCSRMIKNARIARVVYYLPDGTIKSINP